MSTGLPPSSGLGWKEKRSEVRCLDVPSTHDPSTRSLFFQSRRSYRPAEGRVEAKRRQRPGPPPATTNCLLAEPGGGPWANCAWVEVSRGRFVGGRIVKVPRGPTSWAVPVDGTGTASVAPVKAPLVPGMQKPPRRVGKWFWDCLVAAPGRKV